MKNPDFNNTAERYVKIEIAEKALERIIGNTDINVSEFHTLDKFSKHIVWKLCLKTCVRKPSR